mgnify:CR=1 FL=1
MARPDYNLLVRRKGRHRGMHEVGVAWSRTTRSGRRAIGIQLNPGCVLKWDDDLHIELYPVTNSEEPPPVDPDFQGSGIVCVGCGLTLTDTDELDPLERHYCLDCEPKQ